MPAKVRRVTKSVRFTPEETALIEQVSEREHLAEGAVLRKLVLDGLTRYRLEQAITAYRDGNVNLGEAAQQAGVSVQRLLTELDRRGVDTISPTHFRTSLDNLMDRFGGSPELRAARAELETPSPARAVDDEMP
ncbi:MAG: hypothetical protein ACRDJN_10440 [Chloroflexota bacterium]